MFFSIAMLDARGQNCSQTLVLWKTKTPTVTRIFLFPPSLQSFFLGKEGAGLAIRLANWWLLGGLRTTSTKYPNYSPFAII